jgi:phenylalanyl-tRNA synthetase beta chain
VSVPSARGEVARPIDLVEEFLRIHGTDKIPATVVTIGGSDREDDTQGTFGVRAAEFLAARQFAECVHYTLRDSAELPKWQADSNAAVLALANPLTSEMGCLRPTLVPGLLEALRRNADHGNGWPRLAECGRVFRENDGSLSELEAVAFIVPGETGERSWKPASVPDFYSVKGVAAQLAAHLLGVDAASLDFQPIGPRPLWQSGHAAESGCWVKHGFQIKCGLVNPVLTKEKGLDCFVFAGELLVRPDFLAQSKTRGRCQPFSAYPPTTRDLALVVDEATPAEAVRREVESAARAAVGTIFAVESVMIFDVYGGIRTQAFDKVKKTGESFNLASDYKELSVPHGKKSLAFALRFRSQERTLKDDEVNAVFTAIQQTLTAAGKYAVRS